MDPVGPWSAYAASYNRLAGATGGFQASPASGGGDFVTSHHHLAATGNAGLGSHQPPGGGVPSTTSQLLLQAAHTTATALAGQLGQLSAAAPGSTPSPFPGGFLSAPSVGYDSVFSPLFHHPNPKPAHYGSTLNVSQHRQALAQAQAQAAAVAATKSSSVESELTSLRENYSSAQQSIAAAAAAASGNSFFEHQASSSSSSSLPWSQGNSQLPSPFGILPHETVVTSSGPTTGKSSSTYESTFNAHFVAAQSLNHLNSQLIASDFNKSSGSYENTSKKSRSQSPHTTPVKPSITSSSVTPVNAFYSQNSSAAYANSENVSSRNNCAPLSGSFSSKSQSSSSSEFSPGSKNYAASSVPQQPSCIVSTTSSNSGSSKDYRLPQPSSRSSTSNVYLNNSTPSNRNSQTPEKQPNRSQNFVPPTSKSSVHTIQTKAQTKIYPELTSDHNRHSDTTLESSQSSPISFAMIDSPAHRQSLNYSGASSASSCVSSTNSSKLTSSSSHRNSASNLPQAPFQHVLNSQTSVTVASSNSSYSSRHYSSLAGAEISNEYHHGSRPIKSSSSADSTYSERLLSSSGTSQNSPDCGVVVPRRPSPLQAHSQASPLSHVPSPGYPLYNSPIANMSSPSPLQHHTETSGNQCSSANVRQHNGNPSSQQVTPPSPLDVSVPRVSPQSQVAYSSVITRALTSGETSNKTYNNDTRVTPTHQETCWESGDRQTSNSRSAVKFTSNGTNFSSSSNVSLETSPAASSQNQSLSQVRIPSNIAERQSYFDSNPGQVTLQDLSNCRGDPMTIVKNLQTLQHQQCHLPTPVNAPQPLKSDERPLNKTSSSSSGSNGSGSSSSSSKRRKSGEKANISNVANSVPNLPSTEYYSGRVPPPAHHNSHSSNQQSQNGGYFDFERWNLPPPPPKMFSGGPGAFASQSSLHHGANFVNNPHQHPSLMVPNPHHTGPPLPYFPTFPLHTPSQPPNQHSSHEFQTSANSTPVAICETQSTGGSSTCTSQDSSEEFPKVIVPNIEEELDFLAEVNETLTPQPSTSANNCKVAAPKPVNAPSAPVTSSSSKMHEKKSFPSYTNPASGFMASYMKFLQGERDASPPQNKRSSKNWAKTKLYQPSESSKVSSSVTGTTTVNTTSPSTATSSCGKTIDSHAYCKPKEPPVYDPQDDPRYFPLKKERNGSFSDSDDDFEDSGNSKKKESLKSKDEDDEIVEKEKEINQELTKEGDKKEKNEKLKLKSIKSSKTHSKSGTNDVDNVASDSPDDTGSSLKETSLDVSVPLVELADEMISNYENSEKGGMSEKRKKVKQRPGRKKREQDGEELPRRETARRKAKEKTLRILDHQLHEEALDADEPEFMDSDSDPAWTPAKDSSDDEGSRRRTRRSASLLNNRKRTRLISDITEDDTQSGNDTPELPRVQPKPKPKPTGRPRGRPPKSSYLKVEEKSTLQPVKPTNTDCSSVTDNITKVESNSSKTSANSSPQLEESHEIPFKSGEFVVITSDLKEEFPPIWRIDGKTLLQKYEAFQENGKTLYRNISTYSGWAPGNKNNYQQVPVKFRVQNRMETIVEFLRDELSTDDDVFEKTMKESEKYQDNFEVYIQTLISQALDSNFLPEILQEGDEYFLCSVKKVDDITNDRKQRLLKVTKWKSSLVTSVDTWPCFNVISDLPEDEREKSCTACEKAQVSVRVQMYGQPYNSTTLEGCPPDPKLVGEKDFLMCNVCLGRVELYHKVAHQKYLMYVECSQRVAEKRNGSDKDTTIILNELLANESWLNELFQMVRKSWAEIDKLTRQVEKSEKS